MHRLFVALTLILLTACTGSQVASRPPKTDTPPVAPAPTTPTPALEISPVPPNSPTPQPTNSPTATPSPLPTATSTPTPTPPPTATPTPSLRRLTGGGCCVQPFFSLDGKQVLFIDQPNPGDPAGIYGVEIQNPATPVLNDKIIGFRNPDRSIVATLDGGDLLHLVDEQKGQSWTVDTGGNWPRFSPDSSQILWTATDREGPYDQRQRDIWLAELDGSNPRLLLSLQGGGFAGWLPDKQHILLISRDDPASEERSLVAYNLENGRRTKLFSHKRIRDIQISPGGNWIAFFVTFGDDEQSAAENGIWVISADGATKQKLNVPRFGAYRWRNDNTLLYIPMRASPEDSMQLWTVDARTGQSQPLTDPASLSFSISNGDWDVSSDGRHVVFVSSADQNIWLISLPEAPM